MLQVFARAGAGRAVVRHAAAHEGLVDLAVQVIAIGHQHKSEVAVHRAAHLFGKEGHGVRLAAALRMPDDAKASEVRVCALHDLKGSRFCLGVTLFQVPGHGFRRQRVGRQGLVGGPIHAQPWQLDHAVLEPLTWRKLALDGLLPNHRRHRLVDTQQLVVARHHLAHRAGLAGVEQDEVFHDVQQAVLGQHAIQQHLGRHAALVAFIQALPLAKMLPGAGDGAVTRVVAVADNQEGVVVKRMGDHVFVQVVAQVAIETGTNVFVDRFEFDEHQRQPIDETHQVGPAVVVGRTQPGDLEFAHGQEVVVCRHAEINHLCLRMSQHALRITVAHWHPVAHQLVEGLVVLQQRAGIVVVA